MLPLILLFTRSSKLPSIGSMQKPLNGALEAAVTIVTQLCELCQQTGVQTWKRFGETTILQICPHVGSYAAARDVNRDSDVLNHCSCRRKCVILPEGSCMMVPGAQTCHWSPGLAETWWKSQSNLAGYCRLQVLLFMPDVSCKHTGGPELNQSHPALSHHPCSCISFEGSMRAFSRCYAEPRTLNLYRLSYPFQRLVPCFLCTFTQQQIFGNLQIKLYISEHVNGSKLSCS